MLLAEEGREVRGYLTMHRATPEGVAGRGEALLLARESAEHASTLGEISGKGIEPWHRTESGGFLRNVVYGFNDGLTANFGLVAGMIGASAVAAHQTIVLAGVAGLIADALSMGSSGYLAAKSEQEVYQNEISMERTEIELMPEVERDELALIYEAKGMHRDAAHALATEVMADPQRMLEEQVQEELKIGDAHTSPMREAWLTGLATAVGALIPVFPFFFLTGTRGDDHLVRARNGVALPRGRGALDLHGARRLPLGARHVHRRTRRGRRRLLRGPVGGESAVTLVRVLRSPSRRRHLEPEHSMIRSARIALDRRTRARIGVRKAVGGARLPTRRRRAC